MIRTRDLAPLGWAVTRRTRVLLAAVASITALTACAQAGTLEGAQGRAQASPVSSPVEGESSYGVLPVVAEGKAATRADLRSARRPEASASSSNRTPKGLSPNADSEPPFTITYWGSWVTSLCAIHEAEPDFEKQSAYLRCYGIGTLTGDLDAHATEDIRMTSEADGSTSGHMDEWVYARTKENLCGAIQIDEYFTLDSLTEGATVHGWGSVVGGTGDFTGVTGEYETSGIIPAMVGFGGYELTLRFPKKPQPSATPCLPPLPPAPPAAGPPIN